jgi:DNA-binding NtrC family response regulator
MASWHAGCQLICVGWSREMMSGSIEARVEALEQMVRRLRDVMEPYFPQLVVQELRDKLQSTLGRGTPGSDTAQELVPISLDDQIREVESTLIGWAMKVSHGNKSRAADLLKVKRSTLGDRINRCGIGQVERAESETPIAATPSHSSDAVT